MIEEAAQRQADGEDADHYIDRAMVDPSFVGWASESERSPGRWCTSPGAVVKSPEGKDSVEQMP